MDQFETILTLSVEHGLGIVLSVFMAFSFMVLGKRLIAGHQKHIDDLTSIIREREEGLVDHVSDLSSSVRELSARTQFLTEKVDKSDDKLSKIEAFQSELSDFLDS